MKKNQKILIRAVSLLMTVLLISGTFAFAAPCAQAAQTTKKEKTYDIAVVFDNSGSMYRDSKTDKWKMSWCRAKYAMEIFASMLDFSKDKLSIFPMWAVTIGENSKKAPTYDPIKITSKDEIKKIHDMFTPVPWETPFETIKDAEAYLRYESKAENKWLIVLTDGEFTQYKRNDSDGETISKEKQDFDLKDALNEIADDQINVQYLGFDKATNFDNGDSSNIEFYYKNSKDDGLKNDLVEICNRIFQRIELPRQKFNDGILTLDLSMKNIIVFAQGSNTSIGTLSSVKGDNVEMKQDSGPITYSEVSAGTNYFANAPWDVSLAGQVVTFGECTAGEYRLDGTGLDEVQIFYEPDVDIKVELFNSKGEPVHPEKGDKVYEGDYTVKTSLVDSVSGDIVTDSEILSVNELITEYKINDGDWEMYSKYGEDNDKKLTLKEGMTVELRINGRYLEDYTITDDDSPELNWIKNIVVEKEIIPFDIHVEMLQKDAIYAHFPENEWKPLKVTFSLDGKPLTSEQFERVELSGAAINPDLENTCEKKADEKAFYFYIDRNKSPSERKPVGEYELTVQAVYTNEDGKKADATEKVSFELTPYEEWIPNTIRIILALAGFILIILWLIHPVLPRRIIVSGGNFIKFVKVTKNFSLPYRYDPTAAPVRGKVKVDRKLNNAWIASFFKPTKMTFKVVDVKCSGITQFECDGTRYTNRNGQLFDSSNDVVESIIIGESDVLWIENNGRFSGTIKINRQ